MKRSEGSWFAVRKFADGNYYYFIFRLLPFPPTSASHCTAVLALRQKWRPRFFFGLNKCCAYPDIQILLSHDCVLHFKLFVEFIENKRFTWSLI